MTRSEARGLGRFAARKAADAMRAAGKRTLEGISAEATFDRDVQAFPSLRARAHDYLQGFWTEVIELDHGIVM